VLLDVDDAVTVVDVEELTDSSKLLRKSAVVVDVVVDEVEEGPPAVVVCVEDVAELVDDVKVVQVDVLVKEVELLVAVEVLFVEMLLPLEWVELPTVALEDDQ